MNNGYKGMLRDRLLPSWNLALLWCKVKQRWVDTVYERNIRHCPRKLRSENCKFITGHKNKYGAAGTFISSVDPDGFLHSIDESEYHLWHTVNAWVKWFSKHQMFIYDLIEHYYATGFNDEEIIEKLNYPGVNKTLCKFMIKHKHIYYGHD